MKRFALAAAVLAAMVLPALSATSVVCTRSGPRTRCHDYDSGKTTVCTDWGDRVRCQTY